MNIISSIKRVAIVCTGFPIPTETFVLNQVVWMLSSGIEADIFPYKQWPGIPGDFEKYRLAKRINPTHIPPKRYYNRLLLALKLLWQNRRQAARLIKTLNPFVLGKSALDLTVFFGAISFLNKPRYDLLMAHFGENGMGMQKLIRCGFLQAPLITFFYGYDIYHTAMVGGHGSSYRDVFNTSKFVVGVSKHMCEKFSMLGCDPRKIVYCPCPPNDKFLKIPLHYNGHTLLAVGRFVEKKAPHLTIKAFAFLQKQAPDARLVMVGDGPLRKNCEELAENLGLQNVIFTGTLPHAETEALFETAFCFVQHSLTAANGDSEGTPVGILEAGAAGLPVVSTRHGGIPDVVMEGQTGFLVEEGDVEGMAAAMLNLYNDRAQCERMGTAARTHIREHFSMKRYMETIADLINKACSVQDTKVEQGHEYAVSN